MCPPKGLITSADIPVDDGSGSGEKPEFTFAEKFYGRDIEQRLHQFLVSTVPSLVGFGLIKEFSGVGVVVYLPGTSDHSLPWLSYIYDATMDSISVPSDYPTAALYNQNGRQKAQFTLRTGLDSLHAVQTMRHLRANGDFTWAGAVMRDGVVVGVSGLTQDEDHMVAEMVASLVICEMRKAIDSIDAERAEQGDNVPHYWGGVDSKAGLLSLIEEQRMTSGFMAALDGSDGIAPDGFKAFEV
ncbi:MAG: hypothetical protein WCI47_00520 [bacterium]